MISEAEIPVTEQGLLNYVRYGEAEIERNTKRNKKLIEMISECKTRLTTLGYYYQDNQWRKHAINQGDQLCQTQAS